MEFRTRLGVKLRYWFGRPPRNELDVRYHLAQDGFTQDQIELVMNWVKFPYLIETAHAARQAARNHVQPNQIREIDMLATSSGDRNSITRGVRTCLKELGIHIDPRFNTSEHRHDFLIGLETVIQNGWTEERAEA